MRFVAFANCYKIVTKFISLVFCSCTKVFFPLLGYHAWDFHNASFVL